ncbi:RrF2 family transcriptional regulator [Actinosynnema sp. CS-041913]|uniref:RrF2 family transcriptional regulator n=1 Tax=Actinosynnema sp. CS-041913 TaxID=3239917 RepID=UPI003D8E1717
MRMSEGVEWAVHCCLNLAWTGAEHAVSAARLAAYYELPSAYLNKQLQALARDGIVASTPGPRGGFRLARAPESITLLDVVTAIEGPRPAFRCAEIRRRGPGADPADETRCAVDQAMGQADLAWRRELAGRTLGDVMAGVERTAPAVPERVHRWFTT